MKFDELKSIAHNIAHSLASGIGVPIGYQTTDVFDEATRSPGRLITVDFLSGICSEGVPSASLVRAVALYKDAFADLCARHGTSVDAFQQLSASYATDIHGRRFVVTVEDKSGHRSEDKYTGVEGRRPMVLDNLGRVRRQ